MELRLTGTDAESLLQALVPHYRYTGSVSLPAGRHGSGLLSLQTALLVLYIAERRRRGNQNVIIAVEEPELHMPPGVQAQILHQLRNASDQLVCATHSPRVAAACSASDIRMVGATSNPSARIAPILKTPLATTAKNGVRKLFHENLQAFVEALMHRYVLVPEGRTDAEWIRLLAACAVSGQELGACGDSLPFLTVFGIAPTHDACVLDTVERIKHVRADVMVLVDGDKAGDDYLKALLKASQPPEHIVQWPAAFEVEDVVGWIIGKEPSLVAEIQNEIQAAPASIPEIVAWLKKPTKDGGAKTDFLAYEAIASGIASSGAAKARARTLLDSLVELSAGKTSLPLLKAEKTKSTTTSLWRFVLEP